MGWPGGFGLGSEILVSGFKGVVCLGCNALIKGWLLLGPRGLKSLGEYDLYPPKKVVSCFKGAVPPLTNSLGFFGGS